MPLRTPICTKCIYVPISGISTYCTTRSCVAEFRTIYSLITFFGVKISSSSLRYAGGRHVGRRVGSEGRRSRRSGATAAQPQNSGRDHGRAAEETGNLVILIIPSSPCIYNFSHTYTFSCGTCIHNFSRLNHNFDSYRLFG
jgi:hypothetical protein